MYDSYHTEYYKKNLNYLTCTKHDYISAHFICNWNTSFTGHKEETLGSFQHQMPRSTVNTSVSICSCPRIDMGNFMIQIYVYL